MSNLVNPYRFAVAGGPDPSITFTWDTENSEALPGGTTFTRASVKQEFDGTDYTELSSGTIPENSVAVGGGAQGFHPEPAATNQNPESSDYNTTWSAIGITATDDGAGSLGLNQHTLDAGTNNSNHRIFISAASAGTGSAYYLAKEGTEQFIALRRGGSSSSDYAVYDLNLGTVPQEGGGIDQALITDLGNGWHKAEINTSDSSGTSHISISQSGTPGTGAPTFTGTNETVLLTHAQYENTIFSTSPIITNGGAASREADVLDTGIAITTAFSALLDITLPSVIGTGNTITLLGPDTTAEDILRVDASFNIIMDDGGTPVTIGTSSAGSRIKIAYGRDAGDRSASLDGATAVDGDAPSAGHVSENFELGSRAGVNQSRCIHHLTTLYNAKKSDAELETLAT